MHLILELTVKFIDTQPQHRDIYFKPIGRSMQPNHTVIARARTRTPVYTKLHRLDR